MPERPRPLRLLGLNVRQRREAADLTQEKLAEKADLTYLSGIERGTRNATILSVNRVAKALKLSLADLVEGV
ncbi:MAG: hypothetical protein QOE70_2541 [Chthoniobacter sp.]|jgi:transcriptional regulator with XRE-family HTH domain|nr:hypothetical protein [Chthoniobacter sp.]